MEVFGDKKGCDDLSGVWGEVGVWWDFETTNNGTQMTQMLRNADLRRFKKKLSNKKTQIYTE